MPDTYDQMTTEQLADESDRRLAAIIGPAFVLLVTGLMPRWRTHPNRRRQLVEALRHDDALLAEQKSGIAES